MLYPASQQASLSPELFAKPGAEYRAAPFWAWNCALNQETLNRQIDCIREMGMGGFHMHVRVGLETKYLSDEFMAFVRDCVKKAEENGMLAWLYDEDKWPSGFAGGFVTQEESAREKFLLFTQTPYGKSGAVAVGDSSARTARAENGAVLAKYLVRLDKNGCLAEYRRLGAQEEAQARPGETLWYAYQETQLPSCWFNRQTYVDTLSPEAIQKFIATTHERYYESLGGKFGKRVPAIFTDEPQFSRKEVLPDPFSRHDVILPWTADFAETFRAAYGQELLDHLPQLYWELPQGVSALRYRYHDHVSERFARAFADQIGGWCAAHGIMLTGHMMEEDTLKSQTAALGDCMRSYRSFQLPGIDMLCDERNINTAKQAQSAAHQFGRPGVLSELYGVTNWDFPFRGHKLQGDWQAALGVTVRVPHLYWVSMRGEAKRDYPASIGHQSPWYKKYACLEDHFARVNAAMTRGKPLVRVGVIHPVESYWLHWGPAVQTAAVREEMDTAFSQLASWLLHGLIDFDYICESLLPSQFDPAGEGFAVGAMQYEAVLVPNCETLRTKGGTVIFAGTLPSYVDALPSEEANTFAADCIRLPWSKTALLQALSPQRLCSVTTENGEAAGNLFSQWRQDGADRWFFLAHVYDEKDHYRIRADTLTLRFEGCCTVTLYDTVSGEIRSLPARYESGATLLTWQAYAQDSLLLKLSPCEEAEAAQAALAAAKRSRAPRMLETVDICRSRTRGGYVPGAFNLIEGEPILWKESGVLAAELPVTLSEPNVLVLDMPEYCVDGGGWQPQEEILRICDGCKAALRMENEVANGCQPWALAEDPDAAPKHTLRLRYRISSDIAAAAVSLGAEDLATLSIHWNGAEIAPQAQGYYVDEAIGTVSLGALKRGENLLELSLPFGNITRVEACYLLGDFAVQVRGRKTKLTAPVRKLAFGDWTAQGLPFYGGNVTYHAEVEGTGASLALEAAHFTLPVLGVALDGEDKGVIALSPYRVQLGQLSAGRHRLALTAYGNRINTFGQLHNAHFAERWFGPNAWRTGGAEWTYEYRLAQTGVLVAPFLLEAAD